MAGEGKALCLEIELEVAGLDVRYRDGEVDEILRGFSLVRSLSPKDY